MNHTERIGDWMSTYTGRRFYVCDPRTEEVFIEDIAHSLALQCRFNGHIRTFYSVAQHSLLVAGIVWDALDPEPTWVQRMQGVQELRGVILNNLDPVSALPTLRWLIREYALLHDGSETYLGDLIRPVKHSMPDYLAVEGSVQSVVFDRFVGNPTSRSAPVELTKLADLIALATERRDLFGSSYSMPDGDWVTDRLGVLPLPSFLSARSWQVAEELFLQEFAACEEGRQGLRF